MLTSTQKKNNITKWQGKKKMCLLCEYIKVLFHTLGVSIRHRRSENSPSTTQNSPAKFRSFPERVSLFHSNSPATLYRASDNSRVKK